VETLKKTKAQLAVYRQTVLKEAFEGRLTNHHTINVSLQWIENHNTVGLPMIPKEWRYIPLKELGDLGRGKSKHRPRNDPKLFINGKYPFIQTGEVKAAAKTITSHTKKYGDFGLQQSKLWPKGTLCITIAANIAETAFLGIDACFPDSVVGFTPNGTVLAEYIRYFIESQKQQLWAYAPATAQKNINLDTLENLVVPYCAIQEQQAVLTEIEARLSVCDSIEHTVDIALQQTESIRQSALKQAFEGGM
jgi:type I restriction enzyme S subunit